MTDLHRIRIPMAGFPGAPGVMTFYSTDASVDLPFLRAWLNNIGAVFPIGVNFSFPGVGDIIDSATGVNHGTWSTTGLALVAGSGATTYNSRSGACVSWVTAAIVGRRRLRGRTFLTPLMSTAYDTDGTIAGSVLSTLNGQTTGLLANPHKLNVWHRPPDGLTGGIASPIVSFNIRDAVAVLKSRSR